MQERRNSIANALELRLPFINPSNYPPTYLYNTLQHNSILQLPANIPFQKPASLATNHGIPNNHLSSEQNG